MTMPRQIQDLSRLCIHTITTKPWSIEEAIDRYTDAGVKGITIWRDTLEGRDISEIGDRVRSNGLEIVSLCRGGFFPSSDSQERSKALDDNREAITEAQALGAPLIVLVCGADPHQPLSESRKQIRDGIESVLPEAEAAGVKLAIEPLHPMYADTRSAVNTLKQANDMAEAIGSPHIGVALDVYHLWWDPDLEAETKRCGALGKLFAYHVCDWRMPTRDLLLDRGLMGEGCIRLREIRKWVEDAGFSGYNEVEIFSNEYWAMDQGEFLNRIIEAYKNHA